MRRHRKKLVLVLLAGACLTASAATALPRRAMLGVAFDPPGEGQPPSPVVKAVLPGGTAERMGLRPGDRIVEIAGRPVQLIPQVVAYAQGLVAGQPVSLIVDRGGKRVSLGAAAIGKPREVWPGGRVTYGAVPFRGGQVSDILVTPDGVKDPPVVFLLQGFTCVTIDSPNPEEPYRRLGAALVEAGIAYYRVEKPGLGDSVGGVRCNDIDYATELDAFRAAYRRLTSELGFPADRVFMFGHSLGGLEAPMLADERPPRGVAVYGTVLRNWADYHHDIDAFQDYLMEGKDPVAAQVRAEADREVMRRFYFEHQSPREIAAARPDLAANVRLALGWDGGENALGRHWKYLQDMAALRLVPAWRDARTNVLALYGGSDMVALNDEDHRLIADIANFYRAGSGTFVEVADTGHGMDLIGSREEVRRKAMNPGPPQPTRFNPAVGEALVAWIRACLARPAVSA